MASSYSTTGATRHPMRLALWTITPVALCVIAMLVAHILQPPRFVSHRDIIAYKLQQRSIAYREIETSMPWPEGVNYYAYGYQVYPYNLNVTIQLSDGRQAGGMLECRNDRRNCQLTLEDLSIMREQLPDVSAERSLQWPGWVGSFVQAAEKLVQGRLR